MKQAIIDFLDKYAIDDWRGAWAKLSVKFNALLIASGAIWIVLPQDLQTQIVEAVLASFGIPTSWAVVAIGLVGLAARLKSQTPKVDDEDK